MEIKSFLLHFSSKNTDLIDLLGQSMDLNIKQIQKYPKLIYNFKEFMDEKKAFNLY